MVTCKLEYMIKNLDLEAQKRLVFLFDKDSAFDFHPVYTKKIEEFKDLDSTCSSEYEEIMYQVFKEEVDELCEKYKKIFTEINRICIDNNTYPIFINPSNIEECLELRNDLLRVDNEEKICKFFNFKSLRDYNPPLLREVYLYPAVFTKEDTGGYSVTVPDIFGGVTCGDDYQDAFNMAKDMITLMLKESPGQCFKPKTLEETKKNFPNDIVVMIKIELDRE